jgi:ABC-2 type transport system permease protein
MSVWRATWLMVGKDLRAYLRDRAGFLLGFMLPIALVTVAGFIAKFAFGGAGGMPRVTLWVSDADQSTASVRFLKALRGVGMLQIRPGEDERALSPTELRRLVRDGEIHHLLVIEAGFATSLTMLQAPKLTMVRDPDRSLEDRVIRVGVLEALVGFLGESLGAGVRQALRDSGFKDEEIRQFLDAARAVQNSLYPSHDENKSSPEQLHSSELTNGEAGAEEDRPLTAPDMFGKILQLVPVQNEDITKAGGLRKYPFHYAQAVSGITVMMVMLGLMVCANTLIQERDNGTLSRLMVMAVPRNSIFWGKYVFSALIGLMQLAVFFAYGNFVFKIDAFRDPLTLIVLCLTWTAAANSLGMLVVVWANTARQADMLAYILVLVMAGLGGCWIPTQIMNLPPTAEIVTRCMLTNWAMAGFQGMFWDQLSWTHPKMLTALGVQWAFAIPISTAALVTYRRRYQVL